MAKRPKQEEIALEGAGVAPVKDKKLDALCDKFIDLRDEKAALAEKLGQTEAQILERMAELGITIHRFADQEARINPGKSHVKVKTVKADAAATEESDEAAEGGDKPE